MAADEWSEFGGPAPEPLEDGHPDDSQGHAPPAEQPENPVADQSSERGGDVDVDVDEIRDLSAGDEEPPHDSTTADDPTPSGDTGLAVQLEELRLELSRLMRLLEQQSAFVDKLHAENERLQRAELERLRDPFVRDLIGLGDTLTRNARAWSERTSAGAPAVSEALQDVADEIRLVLERQGVETYVPDAGSPFTRREQRTARTEGTDRPELVDTVAAVLRVGYRVGDRILRHADVVVWRFDETRADADANPDDARADDPAARGGPGTEAADGSEPAA